MKRVNQGPCRAPGTGNGEHDFVQGAVAEYCRFCWIVARYYEPGYEPGQPPIRIPDKLPRKQPKAKKAAHAERQPPHTTALEKRTRILQLIYARDGRRCWWCGRVLLPIDEIPNLTGQCPPPDYPTFDHLHPRSKGGTRNINNLVASCPACNNRRGNAVARYVPPSEPLRLELLTDCPDCTDGTWVTAKRGTASDGRICPTCEGSGELTAARASALFVEARQRMRSKEHARAKAAFEARRWKAELAEVMGVRSPLLATARKVARQEEIIRVMADRILTLKVELAAATGADLVRMIGNPKQYERALSLVKNIDSPTTVALDCGDERGTA